jgi:hypothetical protein
MGRGLLYQDTLILFRKIITIDKAGLFLLLKISLCSREICLANYSGS